MKRTWERVGGDLFGGEVDRNKVREALDDVESIGHRAGGVFILAPLRAEDPTTGEYITTGWHIEWDSFAPAGRPAEALTQETEDPELVPAVEDDR